LVCTTHTQEIEVRGDIRTTVEYLVQLLETPAFKENTIDTSWLDGLIREKSVRQMRCPPRRACLLI
jgi:biotin carboxylase